MQAKFAASARSGWATAPAVPLKSGWLFLYGTLMDPEVLQSILSLSEPPQLRNATVRGFRLKMWGIYPALVRASDRISGELKGKAYWLETWEQLEKLEAYETKAYQWCLCDIILEDGTKVENARTFRWAASPEDKELEEGRFDLERFQRHFKPAMLGKPATCT